MGWLLTDAKLPTISEPLNKAEEGWPLVGASPHRAPSVYPTKSPSNRGSGIFFPECGGPQGPSSSALAESNSRAKGPRSRLKDNKVAQELLQGTNLPTNIELMQAKDPGFHTRDSFDSLLWVRGQAPQL